MKTLVALVFAAVMAVSAAGPARAAAMPLELGGATFTPLSPDDSGYFAQGGSPIVSHDAGFFTDIYRFSLTTLSSVYSFAAKASTGLTNVVSLVLRDSSLNPLSGVADPGNTPSFKAFTYSNLSAGDYYAEVSVQSSGSGRYAGAVDVSPVPLPAAAPLFGAGLAALFFLRRRRNGAAAA